MGGWQMAASKTIGLLTSGGDCAGLNAVIRAVATRAIQGYGWRVLGIRNGTMGLLRRPLEFEVLDLNISTVNILRLGGTILGTTNSGDPFAFPMPDGTLRDQVGRGDRGPARTRRRGADGRRRPLHRRDWNRPRRLFNWRRPLRLSAYRRVAWRARFSWLPSH
jgi:hypothetical protein